MGWGGWTVGEKFAHHRYIYVYVYVYKYDKQRASDIDMSRTEWIRFFRAREGAGCLISMGYDSSKRKAMVEILCLTYHIHSYSQSRSYAQIPSKTLS